jgi:L-threonylcarbamoyladenylate synthase
VDTQRLDNSTEAITQAGALLAAGEVVAFPTETVYGLGARSDNDEAVQKVFAAKHRPADNPLITTVADAQQVRELAQVNAQAEALMAAFWPGSLTIILPIITGRVSMLVTGGLQTAAFRLPDNDTTRAVIRAAGGPIVGPSANTSGKPSPTTAAHVWHDMQGRIAAIVDDGPTEVGVESTVVDLSGDVPTILRPGSITREALQEVLKATVIDATSTQSVDAKVTPKAPGMKYRHYAPDVPVVMFDALDAMALKEQLQDGDVVMALEATLSRMQLSAAQSWSLGATVESATEHLFAGLRFYDEQAVNRIYVEVMPPIGVGLAYNNRLAKAASEQMFEV